MYKTQIAVASPQKGEDENRQIRQMPAYFTSLKGARRLWLGALVFALASCTDALDRSRLYDDGIVSRMTVVGRTPEGFDGPHCGGTQAIYGGKGDHLVRARGEVDLRYKVGPGDDLRFNIFGEEGMDGFTARVDAEGYVQLPIIEST
jgi:polysaccharide export outer membrane protein